MAKDGKTGRGGAAKDQPQWRVRMADASALLRPFSSRPQVAAVPSYVQRWLITASLRGVRSEPEQFAADVISEACCSYYRLHAPALPFCLVRGVEMQPAGFDPESVGKVGEWAIQAHGAAVSNGAFAWLFEVQDDQADSFRQWVADQWVVGRRKQVERAGWPVLVLETGDWPLDARLIPGTPVADPKLKTPHPGG